MNEFEKKGLDPDVVELRFKHYQNRLIDTLNRVIEQRRQIKMEHARQLNRANMGGQATPRSPNDNRIQKNQNTSMSVSSPVPQIKKGQSRLQVNTEIMSPDKRTGGGLTLPGIQTPANA